MNAAQQTKKELREEVERERVSHQNDVINIKNHLKVERLEKEKADLEARVVKADAQIVKFKKRMQKFTKRAIEKFTECFCLA